MSDMRVEGCWGLKRRLCQKCTWHKGTPQSELLQLRLTPWSWTKNYTCNRVLKQKNMVHTQHKKKYFYTILVAQKSKIYDFWCSTLCYTNIPLDTVHYLRYIRYILKLAALLSPGATGCHCERFLLYLISILVVTEPGDFWILCIQKGP